MFLTNFLAAIIAYTALEIAYWYFKWWATLKFEPLPIVKSLLSAVCFANASLAVAFATHVYTGAFLFNSPVWLVFIGAGMATHLVPVWKQKLGGMATPLAYATKALAVGGLTAWLLNVI